MKQVTKLSVRSKAKSVKVVPRQRSIALTKSDALFLRKRSTEFKKRFAELSKADRLILRKALTELDKELDAQFEDALQATMKAIEAAGMGKYIKGKHEDRQRRIQKPKTAGKKKRAKARYR